MRDFTAGVKIKCLNLTQRNGIEHFKITNSPFIILYLLLDLWLRIFLQKMRMQSKLRFVLVNYYLL